MQEKAERGGHDRWLSAEQEGVDEAEDVEELVIVTGTITQEEGENFTLRPAVQILQPRIEEVGEMFILLLFF